MFSPIVSRGHWHTRNVFHSHRLRYWHYQSAQSQGWGGNRKWGQFVWSESLWFEELLCYDILHKKKISSIVRKKIRSPWRSGQPNNSVFVPTMKINSSPLTYIVWNPLTYIVRNPLTFIARANTFERNIFFKYLLLCPTELKKSYRFGRVSRTIFCGKLSFKLTQFEMSTTDVTASISAISIFQLPFA